MKDTIYSNIYNKKLTNLWSPTGSPCLSILRHTKSKPLSRKFQNGYLWAKLPYNALQILEHWVRRVCLWIVSLLFDFATRNLHFATNFYHLVAKWRLNDFVNLEPCATILVTIWSHEQWKTSFSKSRCVKPPGHYMLVTKQRSKPRSLWSPWWVEKIFGD